MSLPQRVESEIGIRRRVPVPLVSAGRQRHRAFLSSRISTSGPPRPRSFGTPTRWPPATPPSFAMSCALRPFTSIRKTAFCPRSRTYGAPSGPITMAPQVDVLAREGEGGRWRDVDHAPRSVEAGDDAVPDGGGGRGEDPVLLGQVEIGVGVGQEALRLGRIGGDQVGPVVEDGLDGRLGRVERLLAFLLAGNGDAAAPAVGDRPEDDGDHRGDRQEREDRDGASPLRLAAAGGGRDAAVGVAAAREEVLDPVHEPREGTPGRRSGAGGDRRGSGRTAGDRIRERDRRAVGLAGEQVPAGGPG